MSELELRKGLRAMFSGGLQQMDTEELNQLVKAGSKVLAERKAPDQSANIEYLEKWISLTEEFLYSDIHLREARSRLTKLNDEYKDRISPNVLKQDVISMGVDVVDWDELPEESRQYYDEWEADGWMPSSVTC